jgi:hypothetical protein
MDDNQELRVPDVLDTEELLDSTAPVEPAVKYRLLASRLNQFKTALVNEGFSEIDALGLVNTWLANTLVLEAPTQQDGE